MLRWERQGREESTVITEGTVSLGELQLGRDGTRATGEASGHATLSSSPAVHTQAFTKLGSSSQRTRGYTVGRDQGPSLLNITRSHKHLNKLGLGPSAEPTLRAISWLPLPPQLFFIYLLKSEIPLV